MKKLIIGLTGPTGAGKSSACAVAKELGFKIVDCDKLARLAVEKGTDGLADLVRVFGKEILNSDGTLDRKTLAKIAFSNKENTELLNKTLLPHVVLLVKSEINTEKVILDAPTLFESGTDGMCSAIIAVLADEEIRLQRIIERDSITNEAALLRISAGKAEQFYKERTPYVIYNNGDENDFKSKFLEIINKISKEN